MLSFITLSSSQNKILPKVSYIKFSEIWSIGCTVFIFGSLLEFAFVNLLWRRNKHVELKKVNAKNILKHTLTARELRKILGIETSRSVKKSDKNYNFNAKKRSLGSIDINFDSIRKVQFDDALTRLLDYFSR